MGAKGRKRKAARKAKNRTGLINNLSWSGSFNQCQKRKEQLAERKMQSDAFNRFFDL